MAAARPSLTEAIERVADCPCTEHQSAFLDAVAATEELLFKAVGANVPPADGAPVAGGEKIQLAQVTARGQAFVLAFPNLSAGRRHDPNATIVGIRRDDALRMVLADPNVEGILMASATDNDPWAALPRSSIETLLRVRPPSPPGHRP